MIKLFNRIVGVPGVAPVFLIYLINYITISLMKALCGTSHQNYWRTYNCSPMSNNIRYIFIYTMTC